ncbi:hypothetical protein [Curtobacterium sp. NPDC089689]|uniref:hypothetical protein n=1 Tax=Curtobacterium sp. NPDC089689 TaxID=3363968 RepID=UPI0038272443
MSEPQGMVVTHTRSRLVAAVVLVLAASSALTGCTASPEGAFGCVPRFTVTPERAAAGDTVTFATTDECDVDVPDGGWRIAVTDHGAHSHADVARSDDPFDGSWSVPVPLPADLEPGDASVSIANWDYSPCPADASCPGPSQSFTIER